jgi:DNA-binding IclR family transcriptional regulator
MDSEPKGLVATAQRTLRILEAVADTGDGTTAKSVVRRTGLSSSTVYQYLNTLVHEDYLVRLPDLGGYGLGWRAAALRCGISKTARVAALYGLHQQAAAPLYIVRFRDVRPEVSAVLDSPMYPRAPEDGLAFTQAVHASAFGRIMLSSLSAGGRRRYFEAAGMRRLTGSTPTRVDEIEAKIEKFRASGVSVDIEEFVPDLVCVAAPILNDGGAISGAVAACATPGGFSARRRNIEVAVRNAAARLSE